MDLTPIVAQYQIPASLLKSPPTTPQAAQSIPELAEHLVALGQAQADPAPSPWLRQFFSNLRYCYQHASVWVMSAEGLSAAVMEWLPLVAGVLSQSAQHYIFIAFSVLGIIARNLPQPKT